MQRVSNQPDPMWTWRAPFTLKVGKLGPIWLGVFEAKKKTDGVSESLKTVVEDQRGVFQQQTSQGDFFWAPCLDGT